VAEEVQLSRFPTYTVLNLLALVLTIGLLGGSGLLGMVYAYVAAMCAVAAALFAAAAYLLAPETRSESSGFKRESLTLILPSTSALMFIALFSAAGGGYFYWVTMTMSIALLALYKPKGAPKADIRLGVLGGVAMFIAAILLTSLLSLAGLLSVPVETALLSWTPVSLEAGRDWLAAQLYAVQAFLIVALGEELWARLTLGYGGSAVAGPRTAWFWSTLWFLYMHTPSRLQYGLMAPVIIALLGAVMLVFMVFFRRNPSVWTGVTMHAVYNTMLAGLYYGTLLLDLAVLAVLLYALSRVTEAKVEIRLPKQLEEVVARG
jgi:hypothetical protein